MFKMDGACHCGNLKVEIKLSGPPEAYSPRACDCDFCRKHGAAYLSDSKGSADLKASDKTHLGIYRQGSEQAEFVLCRDCGVLMGVAYRDGERVYAAINSRVLNGESALAAAQTVSPQTLNSEQKTSRWRDVWFSNVVLP